MKWFWILVRLVGNDADHELALRILVAVSMPTTHRTETDPQWNQA
ncbi:hypothetical protein RESH_02434 [Rhodopirellula europaea SH398]|uniref:Uncharacterized protein n=1 Tax=Rhodopirellula europaea SH398 TaxID=1263868 RepID=M5S5T4_9BACT|nr:hypothetical protein RESH_02434 [Rhodopirellula europaea SH398]